MKERIRELALGNVEYKAPIVKIQPESIVAHTAWNCTFRGDVYVISENDIPLKAVIYSSNLRVKLASSVFYGRKGHISYEVSVQGLHENAIIEGEFTLASNAGNFTIPYKFMVKEIAYGDADYSIVSIDDFALYAKENYESALKLYCSKAFMALPFMKELENIILYNTLKFNRNEKRRLEEFLLAKGAKEAFYFELQNDSTSFVDIEENSKFTLILNAIGWGYDALNVSTNVPWIRLPKTKITALDVVDGSIEFSYGIHPQQLLKEENEGIITFSNAKYTLQYDVSIVQSIRQEVILSEELIYKKTFSQLIRAFIQYKTQPAVAQTKPKRHKAKEKSINRDSKLNEFEKYVRDLIAISPHWTNKLFLIYAYIEKGALPEAECLIDEVREVIMQERMQYTLGYCFYLFLRAKFNCSEEQMITAGKLIYKYYTEQDKNPYFMLLYLHISKSIQNAQPMNQEMFLDANQEQEGIDTIFQAKKTTSNNYSLILVSLKELYKNKCRSPLLYLEAIDCFIKEPTLLRLLDEFEVRVIYFATQNDMITEQLAEHIATLGFHTSSNDLLAYRILTKLFEKFKFISLLEAICGFCIRKNKKGNEYFRWYALGVENHIKMIGLNEYYMHSFPIEAPIQIPQEILMYFLLSDEVNSQIKELLYENIFMFYGEDSSIFAEYESQMETYAIEMLLKSRISQHLIPIYEHMICDELVDERLAKVLPNLLTSYKITIHNEYITKVIIRSPELIFEDSYYFEKNCVCAPIYTEHAILLFEDNLGNRYYDIAYEKTKLFDNPELLKRCEEIYPNHTAILLNRAIELLEKPIETALELSVALQAIQCAEIHDVLKNRINAHVIDYYYHNLSEEKADSFLFALDMDKLNEAERIKALETMIGQKHLTEAYERLRDEDTALLAPERLLEVIHSRVIATGKMVSAFTLDMSLQLFQKGYYTDETLAYLCHFYNGPTRQMYELFLQIQNREIPTYDFLERLLAQMIFTNDFENMDQVFASYKEKERVKESVECAYYVLQSYRYFVLEKGVDDSCLNYIEVRLEEENPNFTSIDICNIALLYHYTRKHDLNYTQLKTCEQILARLCHSGYYFGFYQKLWQKVDVPIQLNGNLLIEHRSLDAQSVYLKKRILGENEWSELKMTQMYRGVYVAHLILFADETLEYQIVEHKNHTTHIVDDEIKMITGEETFVVKNSTFDSINKICAMAYQKNTNGLEEEIYNYELEQRLKEALFTLV